MDVEVMGADVVVTVGMFVVGGVVVVAVVVVGDGVGVVAVVGSIAAAVVVAKVAPTSDCRAIFTLPILIDISTSTM